MDKNVTVSQLYDFAEANRIHSGLVSKVNLLLEAINDWPTEIVSVKDFLDEVKSFLRIENLNSKSLSSKMTQIVPDTHSWQLESLASLLEILKTDRKKNADVIIDDIISRLK